MTEDRKHRQADSSSALTRRQFVAGAAVVGGSIAAMPLLGGGISQAFDDPFANGRPTAPAISASRPRRSG